jgi:hypothetical protein
MSRVAASIRKPILHWTIHQTQAHPSLAPLYYLVELLPLDVHRPSGSQLVQQNEYSSYSDTAYMTTSQCYLHLHSQQNGRSAGSTIGQHANLPRCIVVLLRRYLELGLPRSSFRFLA